MKLKMIAAALAASTITGSAFAADLPARKMAPAYVAPVPVMTWAGFYVGLNAGATFGGSNRNDIVSTSLLPGNAAAAALAALGTGAFGANNNGASFIGGAQMGWNWQAGAIVMGLARALRRYDVSLEPALRSQGFMTRDSRMKERKKYGQRGARRRFQFSKR